MAKPMPMQIEVGVSDRRARLALLIGFFAALIALIVVVVVLGPAESSTPERLQRIEKQIGAIDAKLSTPCVCPPARGISVSRERAEKGGVSDGPQD